MERITLVDNTISRDDIKELINWLSTDVPPR